MAYTFDLEVLVREVTVKGSKCILVQKIGERKEHQFKFEVNRHPGDVTVPLNSLLSQSMIEHMVWYDQLRETTRKAAKTVSGAGRLNVTHDLIVPRSHRALQTSSSTPAMMQ